MRTTKKGRSESLESCTYLGNDHRRVSYRRPRYIHCQKSLLRRRRPYDTHSYLNGSDSHSICTAEPVASSIFFISCFVSLWFLRRMGPHRKEFIPRKFQAQNSCYLSMASLSVGTYPSPLVWATLGRSTGSSSSASSTRCHRGTERV